jgi:hypothetical protein
MNGTGRGLFRHIDGHRPADPVSSRPAQSRKSNLGLAQGSETDPLPGCTRG